VLGEGGVVLTRTEEGIHLKGPFLKRWFISVVPEIFREGLHEIAPPPVQLHSVFKGSLTEDLISPMENFYNLVT